MAKVSVFWFRRDLRTGHNAGLAAALKSGLPVLPVFIFDPDILLGLNPNYKWLDFLYVSLENLNESIKKKGGKLLIETGNPIDRFLALIEKFDIGGVYFNESYEPYSRNRDDLVMSLLKSRGIPVHTFKDHVIQGPEEIVKNDGNPYKVFTAYFNRWKTQTSLKKEEPMPTGGSFVKIQIPFPGRKNLGLQEKIQINENSFAFSPDGLRTELKDVVTGLGPHLRWGTVSPPALLAANRKNSGLQRKLAWRDFFNQVLFHYPHVVTRNFNPAYNRMAWENNPDYIEAWKYGKTGFPLVDAGMRELTSTGHMNNRARMIAASFFCKQLLCDWRIGEAWFASHLIDYDLAINNGNWQWCAGTGCDAAPYFRIFNPLLQQKKFDPEGHYIRQWVPEYNSENYPAPIVDQKSASEKALKAYKKALSN
jgi:deoxyribodipyrimidine photo-lyase